MQCLQINKLEFSGEIKQVLLKQMCQLMNAITKKNQNQEEIKKNAFDIFRTFHRDVNFTSVVLNHTPTLLSKLRLLVNTVAV